MEPGSGEEEFTGSPSNSKKGGVPGTEAKLRFCEDALQDCAAALPPELKGLFGMFDSLPKAGG